MSNLKQNVCPVCKSKAIAIHFEDMQDLTFKATDENYNLFSCSDCDTKFQNPLIPENEVAKYYPTSTYEPFRIKLKPIELTRKYNPQSIYLNIFEKYNTNDIFSLIDVGCGGGTFLNSVKHYFPNAKIIGVDVSQSAIDSLIANGIEGICSSLYDFSVDQKFDFIVSSQVLEHLSKPYDFINKLKDLSNNKTICFIDIPATDSYSAQKYGRNWIHWDLPRHSIMYSKKSLEVLFKDYKNLDFFYGRSIYGIISSHHLKLGNNIYDRPRFERLFASLLTKVGAFFNLKYFFDDKIIVIGNLREN
mgnify:CR=1 FL=1